MNVEKRNQLIERIKTLEGLTGEERTNLLDLLRTSYGLVWEDRPEDVEERLREQLPVLVEDKDKALTDGGPDASNHVLIEGDNLEALTTLTYTHAGKIDVIYIDPPYNTGNKDFVYNDSFVDSEDSYRHSKWLSFMAKRLRIAKKLLSDRGVIFISIDDNEQANLKLLCDEIFGEKNFIALMPIKRVGGRQDSKHIAIVHEYMYLIAKHADIFEAGKDIKEGAVYPKYDPEKKRRYKTQLLRKWGSNSLRENRPNLYYPILAPDGTEVYPTIYSESGGSALEFVKIQGCWRHGASTLAKIIEDGRVEFQRNKWNEWVPYEKIFEPEDGVETKKFTSMPDASFNGTRVLKDVFGDTPFDYPKAVEQITLALRIGNGYNSTILDFFAGSGTTLHAVMQLNAEDGGHRQCILVTNNENGICENVTYERNKRVIEGYTKPNGDRVEGLAANNLRYYRTDFVPRTRSPHDLHRLVNLSTDMLCIKEDLYNEVPITSNGRSIAKKYARRFQNGEREMIIIYDAKVVPLIVEHIKAREVKSEIKVYVHSPGRYAFDDDFGEVIDKITLCAIPDAILQAYRDVLPKAKEPELPPVNITEEEIQKAIEADGDYSYTDEKGGDQ